MSEPGVRQCVVDANVVLKLFIQQPGSDQADSLFSLWGLIREGGSLFQTFCTASAQVR